MTEEAVQEVVEMYGVPEISGDGIAGVYLINNVLRFAFWNWERTPGGIMHKVCSAKVKITKEGMIEARPLVTMALAGAALAFAEREGMPVH